MEGEEFTLTSPRKILKIPFYDAIFKRMIDISLSIIGLVFLAPFFLLGAIIIKCGSPGPIFYRGVRAGRHGVPFKIYKFRTMIENAENLGGGTTALGDSRITPSGRIVRKFKLDELPQAINILKGDMSIVGPRPELLEYTNQYSGEEKCILDVRPGITDLSSLEFMSLDEHVGSKDADRVFEENVLPKKNALRIQYVKEQSFLLDSVILLRTLGKFFARVFRSLMRGGI